DARWFAPKTVDAGPLGQWSGPVELIYAGKKDRYHHFTSDYRGKHLPAKAPYQISGVAPGQITGTAFRDLHASAKYLFDAEEGRIFSGEVHSRWGGVVNYMEQNLAAECEAEQHTRFQVLDHAPVEK